MKIAALESAGMVASVAIMQDDTLVAEYTVNYKKTHSQTLLPMLDELRRMTELSAGSLDAVAVSAGPGSFTGLRIGSATSKGLGQALGIPLIPVPTLDALAYNLYGTDALICPIMDARRGQVYTAVYRFRQEETGAQQTQVDRLITLWEACAVPIEALAAKLNELGAEYQKRILFLGDGVPVFRERLGGLLNVPFTFAPPHRNMQSAASVAALGMVRFREGVSVSAAEHAPIYLRASQAERERNEAIEIRRMRDEDIEAVAALEEETFSMPWSADSFREMVRHPDAIYLVAIDRGRLCGTCGLRNISGEGEITNVAVREEYRGSGLGQRLVSETMARAKESGVHAFTLEVRKSNAVAIHVYEKLGFRSEGVRPDFYEKPTEDAVIMWKR